MILHMVLLKPRPGVDPAALDHLEDALSALPEKISGIVGFSWGDNVSPEELGRGFAHGFVVTFADAAARDAYLPHPDHQAVIPLVQAVAEEVLVYDLEA
jgi:hypothetical protein